MNLLIYSTTCAALLFGSVSASASVVGRLSKAGEATVPTRVLAGTGSKVVSSATAAAERLANARGLATAAGLGTGVVIVDAQSGRVMIQLGEAASEVVQGGVDDLASLSSKIRHLENGVAERKKFVLTLEATEELGDNVAKLSMQGDVFVAEPVLGALRVTSQSVGKTTVWFKQIRDGVLVPMQTPIGREVAEALTEKLRAESIRVSALFDSSDVDSLRKLANAAGDRLLDRNALMSSNIAKTLAEIRGGVMVVVGHVEEAAFVVRNAKGEVTFKVPFEELEAAAAAANVRVISAGCTSFCSGAKVGFTATVTDTQIAEAISAMFNSEDTAGMLAAFGRSSPLILDASSLAAFSESRLLRLNQLELHGTAVNSSATGIRMYSAARQVAEPSSEFLTGLGGCYLYGLIFSMLMYRTGTAAFLRQFPRLPSPELPGKMVTYVLAWGARAALYLALAPFITLVTVCLILLGGVWKQREDVQAAQWYFVRHPLNVTYLGLLGVVGLGCYLLVLSVAAFCLYLLFKFLLPDSSSVLFWPGLFVCLAGSAGVIWMFLRFHRRLKVWQV